MGASASSGAEMSRPPAKNRLEWSAIGVFAMLGGLVVLGFAANGLSLMQSAVSLGVGAGVLLIAWLWQLSLRRVDRAPPATWRQTAWDAVMLVAWLAVVGALAWWAYARDRSDRTRQDGSPPASFPNGSDDPPDADAQPEPPLRRPAPFKMLPSRRENNAP